MLNFLPVWFASSQTSPKVLLLVSSLFACSSSGFGEGTLLALYLGGLAAF
jgi:hypothetical protein